MGHLIERNGFHKLSDGETRRREVPGRSRQGIEGDFIINFKDKN
jgi:hypothetical protein